MNRAVGTALVAGIAIFASLLLAAPASALKVKYMQESDMAADDSLTTVEAFCPNRYTVTGGGASSASTFGQTKIQGTHPIDGPDSDFRPDDGWRAKLWNTSSLSPTIKSQAICVKNLKTKTKVNSFSPRRHGGERLLPREQDRDRRRRRDGRNVHPRTSVHRFAAHRRT